MHGDTPKISMQNPKANPGASFLRKCFTVLIGIGLSWATLTNPDMKRLADHCAGTVTNTSFKTTAKENSAANVVVENPLVHAGEPPELDRLASISAGGEADKHSPVCAGDQCSIQLNSGTSHLLASAAVPKSTSQQPELRQGNFTRQPLVTPNIVPFPPVENPGVRKFDHPGRGNDQISAISGELKRLGATYLRLEKLTNPDQVSYRVRCDLATETLPVKCCFEATRQTALAAMQDVLNAVQEQSQHADDAGTST